VSASVLGGTRGVAADSWGRMPASVAELMAAAEEVMAAAGAVVMAPSAGQVSGWTACASAHRTTGISNLCGERVS
jgi:hypothetical protein